LVQAQAQVLDQGPELALEQEQATDLARGKVLALGKDLALGKVPVLDKVKVPVKVKALVLEPAPASLVQSQVQALQVARKRKLEHLTVLPATTGACLVATLVGAALLVGGHPGAAVLVGASLLLWRRHPLGQRQRHPH
jgi:hypothetical protein